jgi:hypothetical protein
MQDQVCLFPTELRAIMSWEKISDWLKSYGGPICTVLVIMGALLAGKQYVIKAEVADVRSDVGTIKGQMTELQTASGKTNDRIDTLLKDALERGFPAPTSSKKTISLGFFSRFPDDPRGGLVHIFVAMFMAHMEIELNCEPFDAVR